jgi:hypothetical protein
MAIVITRTETALTTTAGVFSAMDNIGASSVSSSLVIPSNVSAVKQITISVASDAAEEYVPLVQLSGNSLRDGSAVFCGTGQVSNASAVGSNPNSMTYDTNLSVVSGNTLEIAIATTTVATIDAAVTLQLE